MTSVILLGPPGVGKGTQSVWLAELLEVPAISTGQIFRNNIDEKTELGAIAQRYIGRGEFVPDSVTIPMVATRLTAPDVEQGFILDGYPRNLEQAHALRDMLAARGMHLDVVIELAAPVSVLVERLEGRAIAEGREDDTAEVFRRRLEIYREQTEPIATYYADQDLLEVVDAAQSKEDVRDAMMAVVQRRQGTEVGPGA